MGQDQKMSGTEKNLPRNRRREVLLIGIALLVIILDQLSKYYVRTYLSPGVPWNPIRSLQRYISLTYITNTGAAFGLFPAFGTFFAVIAIVVVVVILVYQRHLSGVHWLMHVGLGLQLGGAAGNLIDRLHLGHVVDFIDIKVWPVFNVADASTVIGVAFLALSLLREGEQETQEQATPIEPDPIQ